MKTEESLEGRRGDDNGEWSEVEDGDEGTTVLVAMSRASSTSSSSSIITGQSAKSPGRPSLIRCERAEYS